VSRGIERAATWMYRGVWGVLTRWFRVPEHPPDLPVMPGETLQTFRPSPGFLSYLKLQYWLSVSVFTLVVCVVWAVLSVPFPVTGVVLIPIALAVILVPAVLLYLAMYLQYDTTWYVLSGRSLRIRSGIWEIHEATITFENIQNVTVESGPIERWFGIGNVIVDTAGGGQTSSSAHGKGSPNLHRGQIAGVSNGEEIRQMLLSRLVKSRTAGLGDETIEHAGWSAGHIAVLREIRDLLQVSPH
jgi:membrane protein YdbS with pleckstrin-like domain